MLPGLVSQGRKNTGVSEGTILLNGFPKDEATFNRVTCYVEQQDLHSPLTTVREALAFSAALRLPASVTPEARSAFVDEIMTLLELIDISDRKVGAVGAPDGLSPGERKRLTIGVELCSNAPVIFADEATRYVSRSLFPSCAHRTREMRHAKHLLGHP